MHETSTGIPGLDVGELQDSIVDCISDGVYITDRNRRILYWNQSAERLTGFATDDVLGRRCADGLLKHCDASGNCLCGDGCPLLAVMQDGEPREAHIFLHHADGSRVPVHVRGAPLRDGNGTIIGAVEIFSDDTARSSALDRVHKLEQDAMIDELTALPNRRYFNRSLSASTAAFTRTAQPFGVLMIDIDHFKQFNDRYGHDTGDRVLKVVANTVAHACRANDTPTRWGGEEFAVITDQTNAEGLQTLAERIRALVQSSALRREQGDLQVTVSVGGAIIKENEHAGGVVKRADTALYMSKNDGRNRVTIAN